MRLNELMTADADDTLFCYVRQSSWTTALDDDSHYRGRRRTGADPGGSLGSDEPPSETKTFF